MHKSSKWASHHLHTTSSLIGPNWFPLLLLLFRLLLGEAMTTPIFEAVTTPNGGGSAGEDENHKGDESAWKWDPRPWRDRIIPRLASRAPCMPACRPAWLSPLHPPSSHSALALALPMEWRGVYRWIAVCWRSDTWTLP